MNGAEKANEPKVASELLPRQTLASEYAAGFGVGKSCPPTPPRLVGSKRKPVPHLPAWKRRFGLMSSGAAEPRSWSFLHQLNSQSGGMKKSCSARVGERRTTASFSNWGAPPTSGLHPLPMSPLPVAAKMVPVESSTTIPPAVQMPLPMPGVWYTCRLVEPLVGTPPPPPA